MSRLIIFLLLCCGCATQRVDEPFPIDRCYNGQYEVVRLSNGTTRVTAGDKSLVMDNDMWRSVVVMLELTEPEAIRREKP